ncbi:MAG: 3'-5' exonuclease [Opitutales bacterium]
MLQTPIHVIDFEGSRQSGVVEYGIATVSGARVTASYSRICAPVGTISDRDREQHGISEDLARDAEPFDVEWPLLSKLRRAGPFCAHNVSVESGLLRAVWPCPGQVPDFAEPGLMGADWGPWLDTLQLYRRIYGGLESYKLQALVEVFCLQEALDAQGRLLCPPERRRYHCALYDALASALLLIRLFEEKDLASASLRWLITQSASSSSQRESMEQQELL